jgi:hypothetical protein
MFSQGLGSGCWQGSVEVTPAHESLCACVPGGGAPEGAVSEEHEEVANASANVDSGGGSGELTGSGSCIDDDEEQLRMCFQMADWDPSAGLPAENSWTLDRYDGRVHVESRCTMEKNDFRCQLRATHLTTGVAVGEDCSGSDPETASCQKGYTVDGVTWRFEPEDFQEGICGLDEDGQEYCIRFTQ